MAEGVSERQFYDALRALEKSLSDKIDQRANQLEAKLDAHARDDEEVADRVSRMEEREKNKALQASRTGVWAGLLAAFGLTVSWEIVKRVAGWK